MNKTIILLHEVYGITESLLRLKRLLEEQSYTVILPSLYEDGYRGNDEAESYKKFYSEVGIKKGCERLEAIIGEIRNSEIYLVGFSVGATVAWLFATDPRVRAVIGIYGSRIRNYLTVDPVVAVHLLFCEEKSFDVQPIVDQLNMKRNVRAKVIKGEHGFYNHRTSSNEQNIVMVEDVIKKIIAS